MVFRLQGGGASGGGWALGNVPSGSEGEDSDTIVSRF